MMETIFNFVAGNGRAVLDAVVVSLPSTVAMMVGVALLFRFTRFLQASTRYVVLWVVVLVSVLLPVFHLSGGMIQTDVLAQEGESADTRFVLNQDRQTTTILGSPQTPTPMTPITSEFVSRSYRASSPIAPKANLLSLLPVIAGGLWFLIGAFLLLRLGRAYIRLRLMVRRSSPADDATCHALASIRARAGCNRAVTVRVSDEVSSPTACGFARGWILLPVGLEQALSRAEIRNVLLHEIRHLARRDDWARLIEQTLRAVFFFHPVIHWLVREIDLQREIACDDWVLGQGHEPRQYASTLTKLVHLKNTRPDIVLSTGAVLKKKQIFSRFEMILDQNRTIDTRVSRRWLAVASLALVAVAVFVSLATPALAIPGRVVSYDDVFDSDRAVEPEQLAIDEDVVMFAAEPEFVGRESSGEEDDDHGRGLVEAVVDVVSSIGNSVTNMSIGDNGSRYVINRSGHKMSLEFEGEIEFTGDDRGVASISDGGYMEVEEKKQGYRRRLLIEPDSRGGLDYLYYDDGRSADFDDDAREWFGEMMEIFVRETGVGAESRVRRIRESDGVAGVLKDIKLIYSDHTKRLYFDALFDSGPLTDKELADVLDVVGREIDSDYEKAELLISLSKSGIKGKQLSTTFVNAVATIDSDYETRRVLEELGFDRHSDPELIAQVLEVSHNIDSDYERAELLISLSDNVNTDPELMEAYARAAMDIDSDYEKRRVLSDLSLRRGASDELILSVLDIVSGIDSDYEKAELLQDLTYVCSGDPVLAKAHLKVIATIDSDYERKRILSSLLNDSEDDAEFLRQVLTTINGIDSDYEKSEILREMCDRCLAFDELEDDYMNVVDNIDSEYERNRLYRQYYEAKRRK